MSYLLDNLSTEFSTLYDNGLSENYPLSKCLKDTHNFKLQLKKLKAHLNKQYQEKQAGIEDKERFNKKRQLILEKLNKNFHSWNHLVKNHFKSALIKQNKFSKIITNKISDFALDQVYVNKLPPDAKKYVERAIGMHISRYNMSNIPMQNSETVIKYLQAIYNVDEIFSRQFITMGKIVQDMNCGNLESCMLWCKPGSQLEFELRLLEAKRLLLQDDRLKTYNYIMDNIPRFSLKNKGYKMRYEVAPLLTKIAIGRGNNSAEMRIEIEQQLQKCISLFTKNYCLRNNLSFDSPLFLIVLSGIISFQFFIKYQSIRASSRIDWSTEDELPFDVKLPSFLNDFHPIFICPVLKEETTKENPPYSLPCHHIISKKSLNKLSKNGTCNFKCPYCPVVASKSKTQKVNFVKL